jgi:hypothetical protein
MDKSILKEAMAGLRKELRGVTGGKLVPVVTIEVSAPGAEEEEGAEEGAEPAGSPIIGKAMKDLEG